MIKRFVSGSLVCALLIGWASALPAPVFGYDAHGRRDPLIPLVGQNRPAGSNLAEVVSIDDVRLEGIVSRAGSGNKAILNGELVSEGQRVGDVEIKSIGAEKVVLTLSGKEHVINLSEEGGVKGAEKK